MRLKRKRMNVFNKEIVYIASSHSIDQLIDRTDIKLSPKMAKSKIESLAREGELVIEVDDYRYIKNGDLYLPCIQYTGMPSHVYRVKSVLTWDMVQHRFQNVIDNYHLYKTSC